MLKYHAWRTHVNMVVPEHSHYPGAARCRLRQPGEREPFRAAHDFSRYCYRILVYIHGDPSGKNKPVSILRCGWGRSDTEKFSILFSSRRNVSGTLKPGVNTTWSVNQGKKIPGFSEIHFQKSECAFLPAACFC